MGKGIKVRHQLPILFIACFAFAFAFYEYQLALVNSFSSRRGAFGEAGKIKSSEFERRIEPKCPGHALSSLNNSGRNGDDYQLVSSWNCLHNTSLNSRVQLVDAMQKEVSLLVTFSYAFQWLSVSNEIRYSSRI